MLYIKIECAKSFMRPENMLHPCMVRGDGVSISQGQNYLVLLILHLTSRLTDVKKLILQQPPSSICPATPNPGNLLILLGAITLKDS